MTVRRTRADRQEAIRAGVMRHIVGADRVEARRAAKQAARAPVAPKVPDVAQTAPVAPAAAPAAPAAPAKKRINWRELAQAAKRVGNGKGSNRPALLSGSWLTPWQPPAGVLPKGHKVDPKIAMDLMPDGLVEGNLGMMGGWAGDALNVSFAEGIGFLGYSYLAALTQRAEYRKISERFATEMTRKWIRFQTVNKPEEYQAPGPEAEAGTPAGAMGVPADPQEAEASSAEAEAEETKQRVADSVARKRQLDKSKRIKELEDEMRRLRVKDAFYTVAEGDGWFGRYHLYLDFGADDAEDETPIGNGKGTVSEAKVGIDDRPAGRLVRGAAPRKRKLVAVKPIEPMWCYPANYNSIDPRKADWYNPEQWYVNGKTVHRSRLLRFVGREVPDILKPAYAFGGLSMSQMAKPYVDNWLRTRQAVCNLIESFSVSGVYTNMAGTLEEGNDEAFQRMEVFNILRSNAGAMVLDKETEEFFNVSTPLGSLDALQAQSQEQMSAVSGIPLIILLGITPKGLNASSEGELRAFYDTVHAFQEQFFRDHLQTVIHFIMLSLWGEVDDEITFEFVPLWSMTDKELAEVRKVEAETDGMLIDKGVITNAEARNRVANDADSQYHDINPADVPDMPQQQDMGGDDPFGGSGGESGDGGEADGGFGASDEKFYAFDEWNEDDHPRGQPGNAGQFAKGSGGGSSSSKGDMPGIPDFLKKVKPKSSSGGGKQTIKGTSGQTLHQGGQKLKMPHLGLTGTPYEAHQKPKGLPESEGEPKSADGIVVFRSGEPSPAIGGKKFKPYDPPESWSGIDGTGVDEPELPKLPKGVKLSAGVIIREPDGRVWMVRPTGRFGGYDQTFPKGNADKELTTQESAIKEAFEETGLKVKLTGFAGDGKGDTSLTRYYFAERESGDPANAGREAEAVVLAPVDRLHDFLNRTRDRNIADFLAGKTAEEDDAEAEEPAGTEKISMADLKKVGGKLGSNEGGQYEDTEGNKFYVKKPASQAHVANEKAAARLYQLAGVNTLDYVDAGPDHVVTRWEKLDKNRISKMSDEERKAATKDFGVHAWLSNWDAAGTGGDNQGVRNGEPVTLDVGGSLRYRAQGGPKGSAFGKKVSEIDTMRDAGKSPDAAKLYGKMSDADLKESVSRVTNIPDAKIRAAVGDDTELADILIARKQDLAKRFGVQAQDEAMMAAAMDAIGANLEDETIVGNGYTWRGEEDPGANEDLAFDASADGEHEIVIRADGDFPWMKLLAHLRRLGAIGASRTIEAYDEEDRPVKFGWDGDGADKIRSVLIDGQRMAFDATLLQFDGTPEPTEVAPDIFAFDEGHFDESKVKRDKDGKFAEKEGGGEGGKEGEKAEADKPKTKKEQIGAMLLAGTTPKELMTAMGWPSVSMPAQAAALGMKLTKKDGKYFGTKMTDEELAAFKEEQIAKKAAKMAGVKLPEAQSTEEPAPKSITETETFKKAEELNKKGDLGSMSGQPAPKLNELPKGPADGGKPKSYSEFLGALAEAAQMNAGNNVIKEKVTKLFKDNPEFAKQYKQTANPEMVAKLEKQVPGIFDQQKPKAPPASEADKAKAKKDVPLQMQYVKANAKPETETYKKMAQELVDEFNKTWSGKGNLTDEQLNEKVQDFKNLGTAVTQLTQVENKQKAEILKAEQEKAAWEAKQKQEQEEKELAEQFAKDPDMKVHYEAMQALFGGKGTSDSYVAQAKSKVAKAGLSKHMTAHDAVPIMAYSGSHYVAVNDQLRKGQMTVAQYKFQKSLNAGLDKMPAYEGTTWRKAPSNAVDLSLYKEGMVVEERGFTSSSKSQGVWSGDVRYTIHGKSGRDISKLSHHPGEAEVLFKSGTRFYVEKFTKTGGGAEIVLREL